MLILHKISEVKDFLSKEKLSGKSIGFVPTMGALHEGHLELVKRSVSENGLTAVSIFVNPIQFNNPEDLAKYPRTLESDVEKLKPTGCDLVFAPSAEEMYPEPDNTYFDFGNLDKVMEGQFRPGHFRGVAVVVKKLFEIIEPDNAYFGEKDYQQLAIIKRMVQMLDLPVRIVPCPIVREADGLAMSSRNMRLTPEAREAAPAIYKSMVDACDDYSWFTPQGISGLVSTYIELNPELRVEYAQVVDTITLQPLIEWNDASHAILCVAVFAGDIRLIDNLLIC